MLSYSSRRWETGKCVQQASHLEKDRRVELETGGKGLAFTEHLLGCQHGSKHVITTNSFEARDNHMKYILLIHLLYR